MRCIITGATVEQVRQAGGMRYPGYPLYRAYLCHPDGRPGGYPGSPDTRSQAERSGDH